MLRFTYTRNAEVSRTKHTSTTTNVVDDTAYSSASDVDVDHRCGWTQILGGKACEQQTSQFVEKRNFYPRLHLSPPLE